MILFLSCSLFLLMSALFEGKRHNYLWAAFFIALTVLTKGLIGVLLPGLIFLIFLIWSNRLSEIKHIPFIRGLLILAIVVLPWFIAISLREPEFFQIFIINHHFKRFATESFGRSRPFWFFSYIAILCSFPWSLLVPSAILSGLKNAAPYRDKVKFLISWIVVILVFFSIPKSKLPYYIFPICVPVAILVATLVSSWMMAHCQRNQ